MRQVQIIKKDGTTATVNLRRLAVAAGKPATSAAQPANQPAEPAGQQQNEPATDVA